MDMQLLGETVLTFLQVGLAIAMFAGRLPRRGDFVLRLVLVALGLGGVAVSVGWIGATAPAEAASALPIEVEFWPFALFFGLCVLIVQFLFEGTVWNALFCSTMGYTVQNLWVGVTRLMLMAADAVSPGLSELASVSLPVGAMVMAAVYGGCYWYFARRADREGLALVSDGRLLAAAALVLLFDIAFNSVVNSLPYLGASPRLINFFAQTHVVVCVMLLCFEFTMVFSTRLRQEVDTISRVLEAERRQYELSRENIQAINLKCHDLRH